MRNNYLQGRIIGNKLALPITIFITILCWIVAAFVQPVHYNIENSTPFLSELLLQELNIPQAGKQVLGYLTLALTAYLLIGINNSFAIVRRRTTTQSALYMLLVGLFPCMYALQCGNLAAPLLAAALYVLLNTYRRPDITIRHSISTMLLSTASLLFPPLILLLPVGLIGALMFHSLNLRSFFSGLLGAILPYWIIFGWLVINQPDTWEASVESAFTWVQNDTIPVLNNTNLASLGFLAILLIVGIIHIEWNVYDNKNQTLAYLHFFIVVIAGMTLIIFLHPVYLFQWIPLLLIPLSFLVGHFFVLSSGKMANIVFILSATTLTALIIANLWIA